RQQEPLDRSSLGRVSLFVSRPITDILSSPMAKAVLAGIAAMAVKRVVGRERGPTAGRKEKRGKTRAHGHADAPPRSVQNWRRLTAAIGRRSAGRRRSVSRMFIPAQSGSGADSMQVMSMVSEILKTVTAQ